MEANITSQALITHFNVSVCGKPLGSDCKTAEGPESWAGRDKPGLGNNAAGARVGAVRGDNGVPPPHPIHIQRQKQGKAPPLCIH